jgi:hypothetical protein
VLGEKAIDATTPALRLSNIGAETKWLETFVHRKKSRINKEVNAVKAPISLRMLLGRGNFMLD